MELSWWCFCCRSVVYLCACLPAWSDSLRSRVHQEDAWLLFVTRADRVRKVAHEHLASFSKIGLVDIFDTLEIEQDEIMRKTPHLELGVRSLRTALQQTLVAELLAHSKLGSASRKATASFQSATALPADARPVFMITKVPPARGRRLSPHLNSTPLTPTAARFHSLNIYMTASF